MNVAMPLIAYNLLQSIDLLAGAAKILAEKCVSGLIANRDRCRQYINQSLALATALVPHIGYDRAAEVAKKAHATGQTIGDIVLAEKLLPVETIEQLLG